MQLDDKVYKPASVHSRISMAKNNLLFPDEYAKTRGLIERDVEQKVPAVSAIYSAYCERCKKANAMDFDDLLTNTYRLLVSDNGIRKNMQNVLDIFLLTSIRTQTLCSKNSMVII